MSADPPIPSEHPSVDLVARFRAGDSRAADELFQRYVPRLLALVRGRLSRQLAVRLDAEDVVQSAYRSFFGGLDGGRLVIERSGDIWRLLAAVAIHKLYKQADRHRAAKRNYQREQPAAARAEDSNDQAELHLAGTDPTPAEASALVEEVELVMRNLSELDRKILQRRLHGESHEQIAKAVLRTERTVRRVLSQIESCLEQRLRQ